MAWELGRGPERACEGISVDSEGRLRERGKEGSVASVVLDAHGVHMAASTYKGGHVTRWGRKWRNREGRTVQFVLHIPRLEMMGGSTMPLSALLTKYSNLKLTRLGVHMLFHVTSTCLQLLTHVPLSPSLL